MRGSQVTDVLVVTHPLPYWLVNPYFEDCLVVVCPISCFRPLLALRSLCAPSLFLCHFTMVISARQGGAQGEIIPCCSVIHAVHQRASVPSVSLVSRRHVAGVPRREFRAGAWVGSASMRIDRLPSQYPYGSAICLPRRGWGTEMGLGDGFAGTFYFPLCVCLHFFGE